MKPEEWRAKMMEYVVSATEVELTADDQRSLQEMLSSKNSMLVRVLVGMLIRSTPTAAVILRQDFSNAEGIQKAQRLQGRISGVNEFLECLFEFASGALGETDNAA